MAEIMNHYELVFILKPDIGEEATAAVVERFKSLIAENGTVEAVDEWGKRRLAYLINDFAEGYYVQMNFSSGSNLPAELYRQLKITDTVLRSLIVSKEETKQKPVAAAKETTEEVKAEKTEA